jgi:hypothetical protein
MAAGIGRPRKLEKIGCKHGRLLIVAATRKYDKPAWLCLCDCGKNHVVKNADLRNTKSCGCLRIDLGKSKQTHGMLRSPEYEAWHAMKQRCTNPKNKAYANYGGRGIEVCDRWMSFENFYADMGPRPLGMSLDRIDNDGPYNPKNCRWATTVQQGNNRRSNKRFVVNGEELTLSELSIRYGISVQTLSWRMYKLGMSAVEAATRAPLRVRVKS